MKRIRVTIDDGIDSDCNLLTKEYDVLNAQRVYSCHKYLCSRRAFSAAIAVC